MYIKIQQNTIPCKDYKLEMYSILSKERLVNMSFKVSGGKVQVIS